MSCSELYLVCNEMVLCVLRVGSLIGVNISGRKSGTERTKKRELVFFPPSWGATGTVVHHLDATRILPVTITRTRHILYPARRTTRTCNFFPTLVPGSFGQRPFSTNYFAGL